MILAVVFLFVVWIVWPEQPKDLTLHLKFVKSEVVDGKMQFWFRVEGAKKYEIYILSFNYIRGDAKPSPDLLDPVVGDMSLQPLIIGREFYAPHPRYSPLLTNYEGCRLEADISIVKAHESKLSKVRRVITDTWKYRKQMGGTLSTAKINWQLHPPQLISRQTITSDVITNIPPIDK